MDLILLPTLEGADHPEKRMAAFRKLVFSSAGHWHFYGFPSHGKSVVTGLNWNAKYPGIVCASMRCLLLQVQLVLLQSSVPRLISGNFSIGADSGEGSGRNKIYSQLVSGTRNFFNCGKLFFIFVHDAENLQMQEGSILVTNRFLSPHSFLSGSALILNSGQLFFFCSWGCPGHSL